MVLMRLFQASRRFHVEIQPQLVLLQKTLLNIEGLGRQLDPDLDLWATAKPFLEQWMLEQLGPKKFLEQLRNESPHLIKWLPAVPRLLADYLQRDVAGERAQLVTLLQAQQRTNRLLTRAMLALSGVLLALVAVQAGVYLGYFS